MSKYQSFIFKNYELKGNTLTLTYSLDNQITFQETSVFDFPFADNINAELLDRLLQTLFFMAGVSYFKTYLPEKIVVEKGQLTKSQADFFAKTYRHGLGEFFYINHLDPNTPINFPVTTTEKLNVLSNSGAGQLVGLGGGKDSLVSAELLRSQPKIATWTMGQRSQLEPLVEKVGLTHIWVQRMWDKQLLELNKQGAYNGHVPFSAILGSIGAVVAVLAGYRDIVVSNESSSSEPNLEYKGVSINHQYSKSLEFEKDFQNHLQIIAGDSLRYYSFLRPFSELRIAEIFSKIGFDKYKDVFSSCNRAFIHSGDSIFWCGECPKCAFVFLILTPFIERQQLEALFHGKNLLLEELLEPTYRQLLGIEGNKPLECVGEIKEARCAMEFAKKQYPELAKYHYELPTDYDYTALADHAMPAEMFKILQNAVQPE